MTGKQWIIGVDIGGTFTDCYTLSTDGEQYITKALSTPRRIFEGVLNTLEKSARDAGITVEELLKNAMSFSHGTTVATNATIERKGAKTGFITTKGFKDHFIIMGADKGVGQELVHRMHFSKVRKQDPLVPHELTEEVAERVDYKGEVVVPLDEKDVRRAVKNLLDRGVKTIAVCLLWSFKNESHEISIRKIINEIAPDVFVTLSHEIAPTQGEYMRSVTTIVNSYLAPVLQGYIEDFVHRLRNLGFRHTLTLMQSIGGVIPAEEAIEKSVTTLTSGPVGGVIASQFLGKIVGYDNIITTDMGGTSFDAGLIVDGMTEIDREPTIPEDDPFVCRYRFLTPMVEIATIGAGGGSIARVERGLLKVGPESAGAQPGPICYGKGGEEPTVTDANIVLGNINPEEFLGGEMKLDRPKAERLIKEKIADPLGLDTMEAAAGIGEVVENHMADLLRSITIGKGYDPRQFVLFSYGGAGPMHCVGYGQELGVKKIIIPPTATVFSAYGIATADHLYSVQTSDLMTPPIDRERFNNNCERIEKQVTETLMRWGIEKKSIETMTSVDIRYHGQKNTLEVPVGGRLESAKQFEDLFDSFKDKYGRLFGKSALLERYGVEVVNFKVDGHGRTEKPVLKKQKSSGKDPRDAVKGKREVYFKAAGGFTGTDIYTGERLRSGNTLDGPAIIEYMGTTVVLPSDRKATVDEYLNLVI